MPPAPDRTFTVLNNGCLYLNGGASKGSGNEFDDISLLYVDRGGFICQFCETPVRSGLRTAEWCDC
jgi:hypothetical protein